MDHQDIERATHPLVVSQLVAMAKQKGILQQELATLANISDVHLSRMKENGKDWRPLSPEVARKMMEPLNCKASQIQGIAEILQWQKDRRNMRRYAIKSGGLKSLKISTDRSFDEERCGVVATITNTRNAKRKIGIAINVHSATVNCYQLPKKKDISMAEAAKLVLPKRNNPALMFFAVVHVALQHELAKAEVSNLENFDSEQSIRIIAVNEKLYDFRSEADMVRKAIEILERTCGWKKAK